jgi:hypothetical protein
MDALNALAVCVGAVLRGGPRCPSPCGLLIVAKTVMARIMSAVLVCIRGQPGNLSHNW